MNVAFNEIDPVACAVLRDCYEGTVLERSIRDLRPDDLAGFERVHFFAGAGLWEVACELASWERPIWTGSCPCQGESVAGKRLGARDPRDLWPDFFTLIAACRPPFVMGEQVDAAVGSHWLDRTASDMEDAGYAFRAVDIPACAVDAPHKRNRIYWVAVADADRRGHRRRAQDALGCPGRRDAAERPAVLSWSDAEWLRCADGKARRAKPGVRLLVDGLVGRSDLWRLAGNSIVPQVAAEVLIALKETLDETVRPVRVNDLFG